MDVDFSNKSGSEEGWRNLPVELVFCIEGYMTIFVDSEKEPAYNSWHNFVLITD